MSRSHSHGKSSLQRFQQSIPKKEYKDEMDKPTELEERVPLHGPKRQKTKPPQNVLSHLPEDKEGRHRSPPRSKIEPEVKANDKQEVNINDA